MLSSIVALMLAACSGSATEGAIAVPAFTPVSASDLEVCGVDAVERERLLALSPDEFDQDMTGGWRPVSERPGCELAAATVLEAYITENGIKPDTGMYWHMGQLLALSGDHEAAVPWLETSRGADPVWDLYVDGTIAFLTQDRSGLEAATDSLALVEVSEDEKAMRRQYLEDNPDVTKPEGFVDEPWNLHVLVGLLACFGEPYSVAYGCES